MPGYSPSPEQESIYNLIPQYQAPTPKEALYRSKVPSQPFRLYFTSEAGVEQLCTCLQHKGRVDPRQYETGVKKVQPAATFGHPYGMNSTSPEQFLKSHAQEPLLPEPKLLLNSTYISALPMDVVAVTCGPRTGVLITIIVSAFAEGSSVPTVML